MSLTVSELNITAAMKGGARNEIVRSVSFAINSGSRLAIVGKSGCGKTMTAMAVLGLLPGNCRATGSVLWDNRELLALSQRERRALLGTELVLIPQSGVDFLNPSLTVKAQMRETLARNGVERRRFSEVMHGVLVRVGFDDPEKVERAYPFQLSGGMAQRVVMAIASLRPAARALARRQGGVNAFCRKSAQEL